ncbi:hypothetical protein JCM5353_000223 [Sporobolomyces roseus]
MEAARIVFYAFTIISATVCWCLAAGFLALTSTHLDTFWRGDVALLVFGILAMLVLPILSILAHGHRRKNMTGPTIVETLVGESLSTCEPATAKFSASYHYLNGWGRRCRFGFSLCSTGRALLSFGWITFGLLSILLPICIIHGILHEKKRKREDGDTRQAGREIKPNPVPATSPQPAGGAPSTTTTTTSGPGATEGGVLNIGPLHPAPPQTQPTV